MLLGNSRVFDVHCAGFCAAHGGYRLEAGELVEGLPSGRALRSLQTEQVWCALRICLRFLLPETNRLRWT